MTDIISQMEQMAEKLMPKSSAKIQKCFKTFIIDTIILFTVMQKTNFTQLGTYGSLSEKTYRVHFENDRIDTVSFNLNIAKEYFQDSVGVKAIAFDPSYMDSTGRNTPFFGRFWSGKAGAAIYGQEIAGIGIVDSWMNECIMLGGFQTPDSKTLSCDAVTVGGGETRHIVGIEAISDLDHVKDVLGGVKFTRPYHKKQDADRIKEDNELRASHIQEGFTLVDWYIHVLSCLPKEVFDYTHRVVADAFFAKEKFVKALGKMGLKVISRMRDDASLWYIYKGEKTGKRGAPKKYDGKVDVNNLDMKVFFKSDYTFGGGECYIGKVYSKALKCEVKVVIWYSKDRKKHKIYFSNDLTLAGSDIVKVYKTRFHIEFEFRDAKGYASLTKCQARSTNKFRTHVNMSFTSLNCLKMVAKANRIPYSISNLKKLAHGQYLMKRFIYVSGIKPDEEIIMKLNKEVTSLTTLDLGIAV